MTLQFEYVPSLDRFAVFDGAIDDPIAAVTKSPCYASPEYVRYVSIGDLSAHDVDLALVQAPREICCDITTACNLACRVCIAETPARSPVHLSIPDFQRCVASLPTHVVRVTITGGEPTLHPHLPEMLKCCSEAGKHVLLSTNGYNTRRTLRALDAAACTILAVSLHGPPVVHDRYVGMVGSYQRAVATLTSAAANGHLVHVLTIATAETLPSLRELALSLTDSAIVEHRINLIRPAGRIAVGLVAYDEVSNAIDGLQVGHKLSVKRRDQPLLFLNHLGTLEVRCERRY